MVILASFVVLPSTPGTDGSFETADKLVNVGMVRLTDEITHVVRPAGIVIPLFAEKKWFLFVPS
jgi:hypothetical protein